MRQMNAILILDARKRNVVEMGGIEPPCNRVYGVFLQGIVCFIRKAIVSPISEKRTKSYSTETSAVQNISKSNIFYSPIVLHQLPTHRLCKC